MRDLLLSTTAALALMGTAYATPVAWNFDTPLGVLGGSHVYTDGEAGDPTVTATAVGPNSPQLFGKDEGVGEQGLGLTNDPSGDHEITPGSLVDLDISALQGIVSTARLSFQAGSTQDNETWHVYASNMPGVLGTSIATGHTDELVADLGPDVVGTYSHLQVTADSANVLVLELDSDINRVAIPEPNPNLALVFGAGIIGAFLWLRRRLV